METLTVKLPAALKRRLHDKARKSKRSASDLVREWIERAFTEGKSPSLHDLMKAGCGHFASDRDGSNKEGFE